MLNGIEHASPKVLCPALFRFSFFFPPASKKAPKRYNLFSEKIPGFFLCLYFSPPVAYRRQTPSFDEGPRTESNKFRVPCLIRGQDNPKGPPNPDKALVFSTTTLP